MKLFDDLKFDAKGMIPAIIQDEATKEVLTLCYLNKEALEKTLEEGFVYVFRRSKNMLMKKGQTSGCVQTLKSLYIDCEGNSILMKVDQKLAGCHEGYFTCYFRKVDKDGNKTITFKRLFDPKKVYK
jgi:phosphoribosyl-AMP cyclohydrolase